MQKISIIPRRNTAFTLIEIAIVLVIIALIVGGVLVGQNLIAAAAIRAQISQIEKYQQAVNTFKEKYSYLPGDIPDPDASSFGFAARGSFGDGNGIIGSTCAFGYSGEGLMFWVDLSTAKLIPESFSTATPGTSLTTPLTQAYLYVPTAKLGDDTYISIDISCIPKNNYYVLSGASSIASGRFTAKPTITVAAAYGIDVKMDDGLPGTGKVLASRPMQALGNYWNFPSNGGAGSGNANPVTSSALSASSVTCFDNGGVASATQNYSITYNNGTGKNCWLSIQF